MNALIVSLITANLFLGSSGAQVFALQQTLNKDPDTRVASAGSGSLGNETNYFGSLTKAAVIRFQEKYASEVLTPAGLTKGSGYVGTYTRTKLNALSTPATSTASTNSLPTPSSTVSQNPNLKNLDRFLTDLDRLAAEQGLSAANIAIIRAQVIKSAATTTDLRAAFLKTVQDKSYQSSANDSFANDVLATIEKAFGDVFSPRHARAATGVPFGGALLFAEMICNQETSWLIELEPLPPSYAVLLTYIPGSQAFLSYNTPFTEWLLGEYEPGAGVCIVGQCPYCSQFPGVSGMISPMVGSSPL